MRDQRLLEDYEKRKLAEADSKKKEKLTTKDWITITLSSLAFVVSVGALVVAAGGAYFNIVLQEDNLSVAFNSIPSVFRYNKDYFKLESEPTDITFINLGNRPAYISSVAMFIQQHAGPPRCEEATSGNSGAWFRMNFEPVVVKGREVAGRKAEINRAWAIEVKKLESGDYLIPVLDENKEREAVEIEICFAIYFSTPTQSQNVEHVSAFVFESSTSDASYTPRGPVRPQLIFKSSGTIFSE